MADGVATSTAPTTDRGTRAPTRQWSKRSERWASRTFAAVIVVAVPVIRYQGRDQWFTFDEWDFLANRRIGSLHDLMAPHNQHWTTFGVIVYRALWWLVGLNHYWPYQLCVIALHLAAAVMLRAVMRRAGVHPWVATAAASLFVFLGSGRHDIIGAFQITFTGALAFGLAHILLADHDGPFDRRDWIGIGFGVLALMCSAVGVMMAIAAGIAILMRRGWQMAVAHVAPLAAVFMLWSVVYGGDSFEKTAASAVIAFFRRTLAASFDGLGQVPGVGVAVAAMLVLGLVLALARQTWTGFRRFDGPTVGLAVAAVCFMVTTAYARANVDINVPRRAANSRYVYIVVSLLLPTIALAASAIVARWRGTLPFVVAVFVIGIPGNVALLAPHGRETVTLGKPDLVLTMAHLPLARDVPRDLRPFPDTDPELQIGWLLDGVASGRVPTSSVANPQTTAQATLALSVYQTDAAPSGTCHAIDPNQPVRLHRGDVIVIAGDTLALTGHVNGRPVAAGTYVRTSGRTLRIVGDSVDPTINPQPAARPAQFCR